MEVKNMGFVMGLPRFKVNLCHVQLNDCAHCLPALCLSYIHSYTVSCEDCMRPPLKELANAPGTE